MRHAPEAQAAVGDSRVRAFVWTRGIGDAGVEEVWRGLLADVRWFLRGIRGGLYCGRARVAAIAAERAQSQSRRYRLNSATLNRTAQRTAAAPRYHALR